jgi:hypothetical protein
MPARFLGRMLTVKALLATIAMATLGLTALPAQARTPVAVQSDATASADLPLTPRFASLLASYRDCVLREVDENIPLGDHHSMARQALTACALSRGEMQAQLLSDILQQRPALSPALAASVADNGIGQIEPMIEQAAIDWAHVRYARIMD